MTDKFITPPARLSYPSLFKTSSFRGDDSGKYEATFIFDADVDLSRLKALELNALKEKFPKMSDEDIKAQVKSGAMNWPFRKGDEKPNAPELEGKVFFKASSKERPGVVDDRLDPITEPGEIYPGCWVLASVNVYAFDNRAKGVAIGLRNVQKVRDGEPLGGGRSRPEDDFEPLDTSDISEKSGGGDFLD